LMILYIRNKTIEVSKFTMYISFDNTFSL
jgi:hypothetical protein